MKPLSSSSSRTERKVIAVAGSRIRLRETGTTRLPLFRVVRISVWLAYYLSQEKAEPTLFIFDEPTTGLHFHDIRKLLEAFDALIRRGTRSSSLNITWM